jgi:hypothetical protein
VAACRILAGRNTTGFTADMEVEAFEVLDATPQDLLVRSVMDNQIRLNLDRIGRIQVAKKLHDAGVEVSRAAYALGVSTKSYERDLLIARHTWMFQHVIDDSIAPTPAVKLLAAAEKAGRLGELKEDLDAWIAEQKRQIREMEKARKAQQNKELRPQEKQVRRRLTEHLVEHWLELLARGRRFDEDAQWNFGAGIDPDTGKLKISSVSLDLAKAPAADLALLTSKLSLLVKQLGPYVQKRWQEEQVQRGVAPAGLLDLDYLRGLGLSEMADQLEGRFRQAAEPDGEADPARAAGAERAERDLSGEVALPGEAGGTTAGNGRDGETHAGTTGEGR